MRKHARLFAALLAVLVLGLTFASCGSSNSGSSSSTSKSGGSSGGSSSSGKVIQKDPANAGKTVTIGSKNFAEEFILGNIYAQALKAAGFNVKTQLNLGSEQIAYKALKSGQIDAYPEYSGTALTSFYGVKIADVPRDKDKAFALLAKDAKKAGITALPQTPFQDTFVVTSTKATAKKYGNPTTLSAVAKKAGSGASISGFPECKQRTDCLLGLNQTYNWHPKFVSSQGKYADLDGGQADFTFGFGTDGELALKKYATYADDKQLFPPYYVTLLSTDAAIKKLGPKGEAVIQAVQKPLTEKVMAELNSRATLDKQQPAKVAADYLTSFGFVKK